MDEPIHKRAIEEDDLEEKRRVRPKTSTAASNEPIRSSIDFSESKIQDELVVHAPTTSPKGEETKPHLLTLDRDIRNRIWFHLADGLVGLDFHTCFGVLYHEPPAFLGVCRQMRDEASEIYYKNTLFFWETLSAARQWFSSLEPHMRPWVKSDNEKLFPIAKLVTRVPEYDHFEGRWI